jgi:drug/metabolite transporter (DMT)-like permease
VYAPASVITAAMRASAVLFSIISGKFYFREKRFTLKAVLFLIIVLGIVLLTR